MPKYRLSPEERAAEKERKDHLRAIMQGLDIKSCDDLKDAFKLMVGEMPKNGLTGFPAAIEAVYPQVEIQQCIIHQIRNTTKYLRLQR